MSKPKKKPEATGAPKISEQLQRLRVEGYIPEEEAMLLLGLTRTHQKDGDHRRITKLGIRSTHTLPIHTGKTAVIRRVYRANDIETYLESQSTVIAAGRAAPGAVEANGEHESASIQQDLFPSMPKAEPKEAVPEFTVDQKLDILARGFMGLCDSRDQAVDIFRELIERVGKLEQTLARYESMAFSLDLNTGA